MRRWTLAPWRSRLFRRIFLANLVVATMSALAAYLTLSSALASDVSLWPRLVGAGFAAVAMALTIGGWLARGIARPVNEVLRAIEAGWERHGVETAGRCGREVSLRDRGDEIDRLSVALRRLFAALSDRIAENENMAADIAHEVRNPLASLRSAAEALRRSSDEQKAMLMDIIEQDVRRLDRLLGEVSNASRLDAELVREQAEEFDLVATVQALVAHLEPGAKARGIEMTCDLPAAPLLIVGLEGRLAQVIVNLIENAVSLGEEGDAIRIWVRRRDARVLIAVEDTGPGIADGEAEKIFRRFYSNRPLDQFGGNSGLGLAISRQIVEAHDGVIWAENIRPTESDILSEPLGARFVIVLPH